MQTHKHQQAGKKMSNPPIMPSGIPSLPDSNISNSIKLII